MSEFQEPISPEQVISTQVRQITALSLSERSGEALKLALELVESYQNYPLVHRCIAKVYQRMDQIEVATKHHEIADRLSEEFFRDSNPLIVPKEKAQTPTKNNPSDSRVPASIQSEKKKPSKKMSSKPSFNEQELLDLSQQLIENTQEDILKMKSPDIEPIPVIHLKTQTKMAQEASKAGGFALLEDPPTQKHEFLFSTKEIDRSETVLLPNLTISVPASLPLKYAMSVFREMYAKEIYDRCNQNREKAALQLGISPENLAFLLGL